MHIVVFGTAIAVRTFGVHRPASRCVPVLHRILQRALLRCYGVRRSPLEVFVGHLRGGAQSWSLDAYMVLCPVHVGPSQGQVLGRASQSAEAAQRDDPPSGQGVTIIPFSEFSEPPRRIVVDAGEVTAVELAGAALSRMRQMDERVGACVTGTGETAIEQA